MMKGGVSHTFSYSVSPTYKKTHHSINLASKSATTASQNRTSNFIPQEPPQPNHPSDQTPSQKFPVRPTTPKSTFPADQTL